MLHYIVMDMIIIEELIGELLVHLIIHQEEGMIHIIDVMDTVMVGDGIIIIRMMDIEMDRLWMDRMDMITIVIIDIVEERMVMEKDNAVKAKEGRIIDQQLGLLP